MHKLATGCSALRHALSALALLWFTTGYSAPKETLDMIPATFPSGDISLAGTLVTSIEGPIKASLVIVPGAGKVQRLLPLARAIAADGFTVLTYDKRGVGKSGGTYEGKTGLSAANLNLLAQDAAAAADFLRNHQRSSGTTVGFLGLSQAGWIVPLAASKSSAAQFMVLWSAPVVAVSAEVDPLAQLSQLTLPALWVFGGQDKSIPVKQSVERLDELIDGGKSTFAYMLYPDIGRNLDLTQNAEAYEFIKSWIADTATSVRDSSRAGADAQPDPQQEPDSQ